VKKTALTRCAVAGLIYGLISLTLVVSAQSAAQSPEIAEATAKNGQRSRQAVNRLADIRESLAAKHEELEGLQQQFDAETEEGQKSALQKRIDELNKSIGKLEDSFEQIAIGGMDLAVFSDQPVPEFDWKNELIQITKPLLNSLKGLTEKPRKIEELRGQIDHYEDQLGVIRKALVSIAGLQEHSPSSAVSDKLAGVAAEWQQRRSDAEGALEIASYQLANLQGENVPALEVVRESLNEALRGRGLTLLLALVAALVVWLFMRAVLWLIEKLQGSRKSRNRQVMWTRLVQYGYRLITGLFVILGVMMVFYLRGDLLLLALSILGLVMLMLGLRQTLPRYISETRLLLDLGPVRAGERVVYNGLPLQVKSIRVYSVLRNPELEGVVRLPLSALGEMVSRPCGEEPWFPCRRSEYVLVSDGSAERLGLVVRQTLELIQLKMVGSVVQIPVGDFLQRDVRNLSREGFGLAVTFGIDYQHQTICLDRVPRRFREALVAAFEAVGLAADVEDMVVDFKEAGANSLDYLVYLTMNGRAAQSYFKIGRLIQQTCVDVCNREGWVIPFGQLTIHQGEGFQGLRLTPQENPGVQGLAVN
jgi:small-conductance mechanosensitive channel